MANTRTNKLLAPYMGYSIMRTTINGCDRYYCAHKIIEPEKDWLDFMYNYNGGEPVALGGWIQSLKEMKKIIRDDINTEKFIDKMNEVLRGA